MGTLGSKMSNWDVDAAYQAVSQKGQANGYAGLGADGKVPSAQLPAGQGGGAPSLVIPIIHHFTTLELTTSANATWKIPAATTFGQAAVLLDMTKLGTPASATLVIVYTNTATSGTNQVGITLGSTPRAAGTTVTAVTSSVTTMANSSTYPQTIEKAITVSELGTTKQWLQLCLNIASSTVGPNVFSCDLHLYY